MGGGTLVGITYGSKLRVSSIVLGDRTAMFTSFLFHSPRFEALLHHILPLFRPSSPRFQPTAYDRLGWGGLDNGERVYPRNGHNCDAAYMDSAYARMCKQQAAALKSGAG